jgi:hypothetical protein
MAVKDLLRRSLDSAAHIIGTLGVFFGVVLILIDVLRWAERTFGLAGLGVVMLFVGILGFAASDYLADESDADETA